jgi:hypothetical protein
MSLVWAGSISLDSTFTAKLSKKEGIFFRFEAKKYISKTGAPRVRR